jgi:hypothetical protein
VKAAVRTMTKTDFAPMKWTWRTMFRTLYGGSTTRAMETARKVPDAPMDRIRRTAQPPIDSMVATNIPKPIS